MARGGVCPRLEREHEALRLQISSQCISAVMMVGSMAGVVGLHGEGQGHAVTGT